MTKIARQEVRFIVPRENLTATIAHILAKLPIQDLSIKDPPVEEIDRLALLQSFNRNSTTFHRLNLKLKPIQQTHPN